MAPLIITKFIAQMAMRTKTKTLNFPFRLQSGETFDKQKTTENSFIAQIGPNHLFVTNNKSKECPQITVHSARMTSATHRTAFLFSVLYYGTEIILNHNTAAAAKQKRRPCRSIIHFFYIQKCTIPIRINESDIATPVASVLIGVRSKKIDACVRLCVAYYYMFSIV